VLKAKLQAQQVFTESEQELVKSRLLHLGSMLGSLRYRPPICLLPPNGKINPDNRLAA